MVEVTIRLRLRCPGGDQLECSVRLISDMDFDQQLKSLFVFPTTPADLQDQRFQAHFANCLRLANIFQKSAETGLYQG